MVGRLRYSQACPSLSLSRAVLSWYVWRSAESQLLWYVPPFRLTPRVHPALCMAAQLLNARTGGLFGVGPATVTVTAAGTTPGRSAPASRSHSRRTASPPRNHRILWKSHIEGVERPQEPRTTLAATSQFQTCSQPVHFSEQWWPISWRSLFTFSMTLALLPHKPSG